MTCFRRKSKYIEYFCKVRRPTSGGTACRASISCWYLVLWFSTSFRTCLRYNHHWETGCAPCSKSAGRGARCMRALTQIARSIFPGPDPLLEIKYFSQARRGRWRRRLSVKIFYFILFLFINSSLAGLLTRFRNYGIFYISKVSIQFLGRHKSIAALGLLTTTK